jgi:DNA-binding PadR family transcriptional regulator
MGTPNPNPEFLKGTLDMLVFKTLTLGPNHGYGIARHISRVSAEAFRVGGLAITHRLKCMRQLAGYALA